jgi:hypothetical protein
MRNLFLTGLLAELSIQKSGANANNCDSRDSPHGGGGWNARQRMAKINHAGAKHADRTAS